MAIFRPGKPWALLGLTSPATQAAGLQPVAWTTSASDGDVDLALMGSGGLTIQLAGLYLVVLNVGRDAIAVSAEATGRIEIAGVVRAGTRSPASTTAVNMSCSHVRQLVVGDTVVARVQLSSGATAGFAESATALSVTRIGPVRWTG